MAWAEQESPPGWTTSGSVSVGTLIRTSGRDPRLVGISNGGTGAGINVDNGNLNFDRGVVMTGLRGVLDARYADGAMDARFNAVTYANVLNNNNQAPYSGEVHDQLGSGAYLNDAWLGVTSATALGDLRVRVGNQSLGWGETSFEFSGLRATNPYVLSRQFLAGATFADVTRSVPMLSAQLTLPGQSRVEAYYRFDFRRSETNPSGWFQNVNDVLAPGARYLYLGAAVPDNGVSVVTPATPFGSRLARTDDRGKSARDQFGVAWHSAPARDFADASVSLYYAQYTGADPIAGVHTGKLSDLLGKTAPNYVAGSRYALEFAPDVRMLGLALRLAPAAATQVRFDYSYRVNQPLQIDDQPLIGALYAPAAVTSACSGGAATAKCVAAVKASNANQVVRAAGGISAANAATYFDREISGVVRKGVSQWGLGLTQQLAAPIDGGAWTVTGQVGGMVIHGYHPDTLAIDATVSPAPGAANGVATRSSWGLRLLSRLTVPGVAGLRSASPFLGYAWDIKGYAPNPINTFIEGRRQLLVGLDGEISKALGLRAIYVTRLNRNNAGDLNSDRDFVQASLTWKM